MNPFYKVAHRVCRHFRTKRIHEFVRLFQPTRQTRILDVGGLPRFWSVPVDGHITILNVGELERHELDFCHPNMTCVVGDGTRLPYSDGEFDVVFSNSVIEHVGDFPKQAEFAREVRRVGRGYYVQTPAYEFPIEPHYFSPFIHWMPKRVQRRLLRNFTLWGIMGRPSDAFIEMAIAEIRLLRKREVLALFPDSELLVERMAGLPKSYAACRRVAPQPLAERGRPEEDAVSAGFLAPAAAKAAAG